MLAGTPIGVSPLVWYLSIEICDMERDDQAKTNPDLNRREFLVLIGSVAAAPKIMDKQNSSAAASARTIDAGPVINYCADGVYSRFSDQGFFVVRQAQKLQALSAFCTHRRCKLMTEADSSFYCKCHGSKFDPAGKVTEGPAKRNLPQLSTRVNEKGHFIVTIS